MRETTFIYALICPSSNEVKYIGKSNNPERRLRDHQTDFRGHEYNKAMWFRQMRNNGTKPILEIIEEVPIGIWREEEEWWISYFKYIGANLLNIQSGGNGLTEANNTSFKKRAA